MLLIIIIGSFVFTSQRSDDLQVSNIKLDPSSENVDLTFCTIPNTDIVSWNNQKVAVSNEFNTSDLDAFKKRFLMGGMSESDFNEHIRFMYAYSDLPASTTQVLFRVIKTGAWIDDVYTENGPLAIENDLDQRCPLSRSYAESGIIKTSNYPSISGGYQNINSSTTPFFYHLPNNKVLSLGKLQEIAKTCVNTINFETIYEYDGGDVVYEALANPKGIFSLSYKLGRVDVVSGQIECVKMPTRLGTFPFY